MEKIIQTHVKLLGDEPDGLPGIMTPVVASSRSSDIDAASAVITHQASI
jgi:hypothetical protein